MADNRFYENNHNAKTCPCGPVLLYPGIPYGLKYRVYPREYIFAVRARFCGHRGRFCSAENAFVDYGGPKYSEFYFVMVKYYSEGGPVRAERNPAASDNFRPSGDVPL